MCFDPYHQFKYIEGWSSSGRGLKTIIEDQHTSDMEYTKTAIIAVVLSNYVLFLLTFQQFQCSSVVKRKYQFSPLLRVSQLCFERMCVLW